MVVNQSFFSFGQVSRPDIGLLADSSRNLSEIFESDRRTALENIHIKPEILDSLYGLRDKLDDREDFRSCSGLENLLLPTLNQLSEVFEYEIPYSLFVRRDFYTPDYSLGGDSSPGIKYPNVVLFNGSIQCEGAQYLANVIGSTVFSNPERKRISISSSRASLFSSEADPVNVGYFKSARYAGSIRVRRRSHVNRINIPSSSFLPKPAIVENPSHTVNLFIDNNNSGVNTPVKILATKNTPLRVFCRMAKGKVKFTFTDSAGPYFYGFQVQPVQIRPNTAKIDYLSITSVPQTTGSVEYTVSIDITSTGYQNLYDLYLYLYVNPVKVKGIEFSGIDIREAPDKKDLGLVGFDNLESFVVSGGSMTVLPLWLKTLRTKLKTLNLAASGNVWRSGPMGWFDIRDPSRTPSLSEQKYTAVSYLTVPKRGVFINETGTAWSDPLFSKYILNQSRVAGTDYRQFTALESLILGQRFSGYSPRFDDVFPNLKVLDWSNKDESRGPYRYLFGALPKLANNGLLIDYDIYGSGAEGNITDIGTSTINSNSGHISRYKIRLFNVGGRSGQSHNITGYINNPSDPNWSAWRENTIYIDVNRTPITVNLQSGQWDQLTVYNGVYSGGAKFDINSSVIRAPNLNELNLYGSLTDGKMPSLGQPTDTANLTYVNMGECSNISPVVENGINYLLPSNFAPARLPGSEHKLNVLSFAYCPLAYRFRKNDLVNLNNLEYLNCDSSLLTGKFPIFPLKSLYETDTKSIRVYISNSNFYDLSTLSISPNSPYFARDIVVLSASGCNISGGGAILPSFEGVFNTLVSIVDISGSLSSRYGADWSDQALRSSCVLDSHSPTSISGLSITRYIQDDIYILSGVTNLNQKVLVNDSIRGSLGGLELAKVLSVTPTSIVISSDIPDPLPSTLFFYRGTIDISNWFKNGFSSLSAFNAGNCRLSGNLNIRTNLDFLADSTSYLALNLSNNAITSYTPTSLSRVFRGNSRRITVDLSNNSLSISSIRSIIDDVVIADSGRRFTNCLVRLSGNKLTESSKYSNYTQQEVFPTTILAGRDIVTYLFRNESFQVYSEIEVVDSQQQPSYVYILSGTQTLQFPGTLVSGTYYQVKRDKTQYASEDPLAIKYKKLSKVLVDLGFTYRTPNTSSVIVSTTYENPTTRFDSITNSGLIQLQSCPGDIGSGTCWRNSLNQILKLV